MSEYNEGVWLATSMHAGNPRCGAERHVELIPCVYISYSRVDCDSDTTAR